MVPAPAHVWLAVLVGGSGALAEPCCIPGRKASDWGAGWGASPGKWAASPGLVRSSLALASALRGGVGQATGGWIRVPSSGKGCDLCRFL